MSTKPVRVAVLVCSTRPNALGPTVGQWLLDTLTPHAASLGVELVPVSLADMNLPLLDEEEHPSSGIYHHEHTLRWSATVDAMDGFIVITPEYNYGMPATLKNALDYLGREWAWKPIGFVSYGNTSAGTRAVQHAKAVVTTLRLVPLAATVAIRIGEAVDAAAPERRLRPDRARDDSGVRMLSELVRLAHALRPMREHPRAMAGPLPGSYLKRLTPEDAPEVTVLQRCCWAEEALVNDTLAIPALHESLDEIREWLATWHTSGLWLDGRLLGMVRTKRLDTDWHIGRLAVVPDLRGRGLGRWLLRNAEATADPHCQRVVLFTGAKSLHNIELYRGAGYQPMPSEVTEGTIRLTKDLPTRSAVERG